MTRADHLVKRFQTTLGDSWWWRRKADLIDRRQGDGTTRPFDYQAHKFVMTRRNRRKYGDGPVEILQPIRFARAGAAKPEMLPRPEGMTRQAHRRLFREACKLAGVPWRAPRTFKTPRRERGRNWKDLSPEELAKLDAQWAEFTKNSARIE